jgi:inorganic triphosphatase YgiF
MKNLSNIIKKVLKEEEKKMSSRYMFFSNLQQMRRQCDLLLDLEPSMVEEILEDGHDWAQDHIAEAKNNMDQVFDFLMNETKKSGMQLSMNIDDKDMIDEDNEENDESLAISLQNPNLGLAMSNMNEGRKKKKNVATNKDLWQQCLSWAKRRYDVCPSAYCNGAAVKRYNSKGGKWKKE